MKGKWKGLRIAAVLGLATMTAAAPARADAVIDWNATADATSASAGGPPIRARITAMVQVAVHDALNSIDAAVRDSIPDCRARTAAPRRVPPWLPPRIRCCWQTVPSQAAALGVDLQRQRIAGLPCPASAPERASPTASPPAKRRRAAILALRAGDGSATPHLPYTLPPGAGRLSADAARARWRRSSRAGRSSRRSCSIAARSSVPTRRRSSISSARCIRATTTK